MELKYKVEYNAASQARYDGENWKSGCRRCKSGFKQGALKLSAHVQSFRFDGKETLVYHFECFFSVQRPKSINDIENYENIRYEDQQKIQQKIDEFYQPQSSGQMISKKGQKRSAPKIVLSDYGVQYSVSSRAECVGCRSKIMKGVVRVFKTVYDTEVGMKFGGQPFWHHLDCFAQICGDNYGFNLSGDKLPGFRNLSAADQQTVRDALQQSGAEPALKKKAKKVKTETSTMVKIEDGSNNLMNDALEATIALQTMKLFEIRDEIKSVATPGMLHNLLSINNSKKMDGFEANLDRCADFLTFGAIIKCQKCLVGDMIFSKHGYKCNGMVDEWTECGNFTDKPMRMKCKIPDALKRSNKENFFSNFKPPKIQDRAVRPYVKFVPSSSAYDIKVQRKREPLYNMFVVAIGTLSAVRADIKARVEKMGGKLITKLQEKIAVVISTEQEVEKMNKRMQQVKSFNIQVVPESFLDSVINGSPDDTIEMIKMMNICEWGSDPLSRISLEEETRGPKESIYSRGSKKVANVKIKDGKAIDPDSGLDDVAHVYKRENVLYTSVLGLADIKKNKNSYFKLQVLQSDDLRRYWLFSSWGRIGTKVGDSKKEEFMAPEMACVEFERLYRDKTGNRWNSKDDFKKKAGKFYPIEVDYEDDKKLKMLADKNTVPSKLALPIQDLIKMLFDVDFMKQTMMEFELDMVRMPLGRLSKKQLQEANLTLTELSNLTARGASNAEFVGLSNKFYTLVPHNFGMKSAPVIDTLEIIKNKREMIDSLLEIEIAYSMLQEDTNDELNILDCRYDQLKTKLEPLDHETEEFKLLNQYVQNTHAATHSNFKLLVEDVFKVKRQGEATRYKPFKKLHNRQLLWHGSRLTNFVGILSNGLKIAPPEAPVTGYMFGKGIYFADMVSKSANYCFTSPEQQVGLMLLSEVALGDTHNLTRSQYVKKLPDGKHSTKGLGKTVPDPKMSHTRKDGVIIPMGKPVIAKDLQSELLYNEYIVYDAAQVKVQYLLKMKFDYGR